MSKKIRALATAAVIGAVAFGGPANAVVFDFGAIAEGDFTVWGLGTVNLDTGEAGNNTSDAEGNWSLVVPLIDDSSEGGTLGDNLMTIGGIGVEATGSNVIGTSPVDAFLDSFSGGLPGGLGVCSSTSCTTGVDMASTGDDNVSGAEGGETLKLSFTTSVIFDPTAFEFRNSDHGLLDGTIDINGMMASIVGGSLSGPSAALLLSLTGNMHTFAYTQDEFYLTVADVSAVPLPPAVLLFGSALAGMGFLSRRRKSKPQIA